MAYSLGNCVATRRKNLLVVRNGQKKVIIIKKQGPFETNCPTVGIDTHRVEVLCVCAAYFVVRGGARVCLNSSEMNLSEGKVSPCLTMWYLCSSGCNYLPISGTFFLN